MRFEPKNRKVESNCDGYRSQDWTGQQEYNFHLLQVVAEKVWVAQDWDSWMRL